MCRVPRDDLCLISAPPPLSLSPPPLLSSPPMPKQSKSRGEKKEGTLAQKAAESGTSYLKCWLMLRVFPDRPFSQMCSHFQPWKNNCEISGFAACVKGEQCICSSLCLSRGCIMKDSFVCHIKEVYRAHTLNGSRSLFWWQQCLQTEQGTGTGDLLVHKELQGLRRQASANNRPSPLTQCTV